MLISIVINDISINGNSWLKGMKLLFDSNLDLAYKEYYYKGKIPQSVIITGNYPSGKSTLFYILSKTKDFVLKHFLLKDCYEKLDILDFEICFLCNDKYYFYHIFISDNNCYEELKLNNKVIVHSQNSYSVISIEIYSDIYKWFRDLYFIPSCYDNQDFFTKATSCLPSKEHYNDLLSIYRLYFQNKQNANCLMKIEGDMNFSNFSLKLIENDIKTYTLLGTNINRSTYDLLLSIKLINYIRNLTSGVVIIDDIDLIYKGLFSSIINATFITKKANNPVQLIATANAIHKKYFKPSKHLLLQPLF